MPNRIIHESMLQIDYDQRCPGRVEFGEAVLLAAARNDALHDEIGDRGAIQLHGMLLRLTQDQTWFRVSSPSTSSSVPIA
jgi:hypothetical protein